MKGVYVKPVINKLEPGLMNTIGPSRAKGPKVREDIDGAPVQELVERFGAPLYVYSEKSIRSLAREAQKAFAAYYPNVRFGWSYKTNYLKAICAVMHQEGALAEVVSDMEYDKARNLGVPGHEIIFNGPYKPMPALRRAIQEGAMINVDHLDEIQDLETLAEELDQTVNVGMRLNLDAGIYPQWSRFGFNLETSQAMNAAKAIASEGRLRINGLHCHLGTYILDPGAYGRQAAKMVAFARELEEELGFVIDYIDVGGGLPSHSRLKSAYMPADIAVPDMEEYAEAIGEAMLENLPEGRFPLLILEAGRALIDEAGFLLTNIIASKRTPDGMRAYVADAGLNVLFTSLWYKHTIELGREIEGVMENSIIYGSLCMNIDVLDECVLIPPLERGDTLVLSPVGAYNNTQSMQFIHYRPNVVMVGEDGQVDVIREAEDLRDIEHRERLPERLELSGRSNHIPEDKRAA